MSKILNIANFLPSTVTTRKAIEVIGSNLLLSGNNEVVFNFEHIEFISRAFADEFIHFIHNNQIKARFINVNTIVSEMLSVVEKNREGKKRSYHNIAVTDFTQREQIHQLLSLI